MKEKRKKPSKGEEATQSKEVKDEVEERVDDPVPRKKSKRSKKDSSGEEVIHNSVSSPKSHAVKKNRKKKSKKKEARTGLKLMKTVQYGEEVTESSSFDEFNLDERLLKAVGEIGWEKPTQIQCNLIPLILEDKNVTARGRTGSGKTGAFMLPIIQKVVQLTSMSSSSDLAGPFALFITPSKELATQAFKLLQQLTSTFPFLLSMNYAALDLADEEVWLKEKPEFLVSTPSRLLRALRKNSHLCDEVRHVVLDEADLLLSYGYEEDMKHIRSFLPARYQTIFTSATLSEDIGPVREMFINGPLVTLKLKEGQLPSTDQLSQYHINCRNDEERFAIFLSLIKLKLIVGKTIVFVANTNRCYQLGMFLQAFQIRSCILNAQMPVNSRCHVVQEFNDGRYNYVIASDVNDVIPLEESTEGNEAASKKTLKSARRKMDKESGVSRGIDFHHVSNVVNFDFPNSVDSYVHRVGRTARGWNKGTALSFATPEEQQYLEQVQDEMKHQMGHEAIMPYEIRLKELESFLLRAREALNACTKTAIREARLAEIRAEVLRSQRLEGYFVKNPREKAALEHDKKLHTLALHSPAIADVPDYMVPPSLRGMKYGVEEKPKRKRGQRPWAKQHMGAGQMKYKKKMADPLQSFSI